MINETNKTTWCVNADHAMSGNNTGTTKICCMYRDEGLKHSLGLESIQENFNQEDFIKVRNTLNQGIRHPACNWCFQEEDAGRKSKRLRDNEKYLDHLKKGGKPFEGLAKFELNLGNTCNLKCRTCAPHSSSTWMQEYYDVYEVKRFPTYKSFAIDMRKYHQWYDDESPFWDDLENNLPTIKQFDFYGGEPFMSKKMWKILKVAVERGYSKDMEIHYATNGTQWPKEVEIFKNFKHVHISFSTDGVGPGFEYMRHPAKWDEVQQNMRNAVKFRDSECPQLYLGWCITLSNLNIWALPEMLKEHNEKFREFGPYLNLVHGPKHFNLAHMPEGIKEKVIERLSNIPKEWMDSHMYNHHLPGIINYIKLGTPDDQLWEEFKRVTKVHDEYRQEKFSDVYPEYASLIGM